MSARSGEMSDKPPSGKLRNARGKGDIPRSKDMTMATGLLASFITMTVFFPFYKHLISESFQAVSIMGNKLNDDGVIEQFLLSNVFILFKFIATLITIHVACIVAILVTGCWIFTPNKIITDFKNINPISGVKSMFYSRHYVDVGKILAKCGLLLVPLYLMLNVSLTPLLQLQNMYLRQAIIAGFDILHHGLSYFVAIIVIFAFIDVPLSKFMFTKRCA